MYVHVRLLLCVCRPSLHADRPIPFDLASGDHAVDGSEEEITKPPEYTVEEILARFNLQSCAAKFSEEKVDFEILVRTC